jgi:hypothetical protein
MEERWEIVAARYDSEYNICATFRSSVTGDLEYGWYLASESTPAPALAVELANKDEKAYYSDN